jgi:prolyl-tRNA editing enzyme YbaK/EbsC (Cys-tRNA(Pro) deacylase)
MSEKVDSVKELANSLNFQCEIFYHEQSGKSTEEAVKATGIDSTHIIKCLLLKSKSQEYIGAIIRGSDRLDFKILEKFLGCKELRMASVEEIQEKLGFEPGGIPVIIFFEKGIRTFVDIHVLSLEYVVGSGGTPFYGMKFNPKQLIEKLNYIPANIVKVQK